MMEPPRDLFRFLARRLLGYLLMVALICTSLWLMVLMVALIDHP